MGLLCIVLFKLSLSSVTKFTSLKDPSSTSSVKQTLLNSMSQSVNRFNVKNIDIKGNIIFNERAFYKILTFMSNYYSC